MYKNGELTKRSYAIKINKKVLCHQISSESFYILGIHVGLQTEFVL